jgi:hypothetical protein
MTNQFLLMRQWCRGAKRDPDVQAWLASNPPPADWKDSPEAWAWGEKTGGSISRTIALGEGR